MGFFSDIGKAVGGVLNTVSSGIVGGAASLIPGGTLVTQGAGILGGILGGGSKPATGGAAPSQQKQDEQTVNELLKIPEIKYYFDHNLPLQVPGASNDVKRGYLLQHYKNGVFGKAIADHQAGKPFKPDPSSPNGVVTGGNMPPANAKTMTSTSGLTGNEYIDALLGGALAGVGTQIGNKDITDSAGTAVGQSTITAWLKHNWWIALLGLTLIVFMFYFFINPRKRRTANGRTRWVNMRG